MKWISTKDRLPELENGVISKKVVIAQGVNDKQVCFGWYEVGRGGRWLTSDMKPFARQEMITHWMSLPEVPEPSMPQSQELKNKIISTLMELQDLIESTGSSVEIENRSVYYDTGCPYHLRKEFIKETLINITINHQK